MEPGESWAICSWSAGCIDARWEHDDDSLKSHGASERRAARQYELRARHRSQIVAGCCVYCFNQIFLKLIFPAPYCSICSAMTPFVFSAA